MGPSNEYNLASTGGGGKLKLKGSKVADGRVEKKKGKKGKKKKVEKEQEQREAGERSKSRDGSEEGKGRGGGGDGEGGGDDDEEEEKGVVVGKTESEKRHEEVRRKRLDERLKREGVKTHKERVEELNKYLSTLSEHHDMPRIGPG